VAAETGICYIDGEQGVLSYRGYDINELAPNATFEEVVYLLWEGRLPTQAELAAFREELAENRGLPPAAMAVLREIADKIGPMDAVRTTMSALAAGRDDADEATPESDRRKAVQATAQLATIVAHYHRLRRGLPIVPPDPRLGHAANFLYMLSGERPKSAAERALDVALILHADHDLNASTFAARVTAATFSDYHSAIVSAIGALKGPLHGGANIGVMRMLLEIDGQGVDPAEYVRRKLAAKERIMGFGHRVYKTLDPRAVHLADLSEALGEQAGERKWYEMSRKVQETVKAEKGLDANVDFFSASSYYIMGIPLDLYTPIFAISRVAGWSAHIIEQHANNRLIRPVSDYKGEHGRKWVPVEERERTLEA